MEKLKDTISVARTAYKHRKIFEKDGEFFQKVNKTIHHAKPFIEYAADAISSRIRNRKKTTISEVFETTTWIPQSFEESSMIVPSSSEKEMFSSSQRLLIGIVVLSVMLVLIIILFIRIFWRKSSNSRESYSSSSSFLSVGE